MEIIQYVITLDINMEYYTISLSPDRQYMTTIVTESVKFNYNRLHMGMCALGEIFQAKVYEMPGDIKGVKIYINDILVLIKESFYSIYNNWR